MMDREDGPQRAGTDPIVAEETHPASGPVQPTSGPAAVLTSGPGPLLGPVLGPTSASAQAGGGSASGQAAGAVTTPASASVLADEEADDFVPARVGCRTDLRGWAGAHLHGAVRPRRRAAGRGRPPGRWC